MESISKYRENSPSLLKLQVSQPIFGINIAKLRSYYIHSYLPNLFYVTYPKNVPLSLRNYFNYVTWIFHHLLNHFFRDTLLPLAWNVHYVGRFKSQIALLIKDRRFWSEDTKAYV